jgi:hypothetical protein
VQKEVKQRERRKGDIRERYRARTIAKDREERRWARIRERQMDNSERWRERQRGLE